MCSEIETVIEVTFTRLGYLAVNSDAVYTCHIYYWGSSLICRKVGPDP